MTARCGTPANTWPPVAHWTGRPACTRSSFLPANRRDDFDDGTTVVAHASACRGELQFAVWRCSRTAGLLRMLGGKPHSRPRVQDLHRREGGTESLQKTLPRPTAAWTPPSKLLQPHALHIVAKRPQSCLVVRYGMVLEISANNRAQPLRRIRCRRVHPLAQRLPNIFQLGGPPFADRPAVYREVPPLPAAPTNVGKPQKVEGLRLPFPRASSGARRHIARIRSDEFYPGATPVRTSASVPATAPGSALRRCGAEIPAPRRRHTAR